MAKKVKYYDNPYQTERWSCMSKAERERNEMDDAIQGTVIGIGLFIFIVTIICLKFIK